MQRFGEVYLQIRYLEIFDFDCREDRERVLHEKYLSPRLGCRAEELWHAIGKTPSVDVYVHILERKEFHDFENQLNTTH